MKTKRRRSGVVLVLVLVVIAMLTLAGLAFTELMVVERKAAVVSGQQVQARALAESGVELARQFLAQDKAVQDEQRGCYNNPELFQGLAVSGDDQSARYGRVTLVAPYMQDRGAIGVRYGLEDQSAKINLRTLLDAEKTLGQGAAKKVLLGLPGMTDTVADCILDWLDEDDTPREYGAESEYYGTLTPAYQARNGPPATIEELLQVRGVTPQLLLGAAAAATMPSGNGDAENGTAEVVIPEDGTMDRGWSAYLTLYSCEQPAVRADGTAKINLNQSDMKTLFNALEQEFGTPWATFIVAYRQNGPVASATGGSSASGTSAKNSGGGAAGQSGGNASAKPGSTTTPAKSGSGTNATSTGPSPLDLTKSGGTELTSVLDLVGVRTKTKSSDTASLPSPFTDDRGAMSDYLPKLMAATTIGDEPVAGRININQAPRVVLRCLLRATPGIAEESAEQLVDQIISKQPIDFSTASPDRQYPTWLLSEGIVDLKTMKAILPLVNTGGSVYRVEAVGFFDGGGPTARIEAVVDAGKKPASIVFWRELTYLGRAYPLEVLGVSQ
jgi:type II secretory pathway component PulK